MNTTSASDSPHVIAPPPFMYLTGIATGLILHWFWPLLLVPDKFTIPLGSALVAISVVQVVAAFRVFIKAKTNIDVRKPTTSIVSTGPYQFTRNPIYVSMTLFTIGIAVWINTLWVLITLAPVLLVMQFGVIAREEVYLTKKFGEEYLRYKAKVRRWL
jgi:protein-S-isoprenylcysteine O-methyltransferase Ste14